MKAKKKQKLVNQTRYTQKRNLICKKRNTKLLLVLTTGRQRRKDLDPQHKNGFSRA